MNRSVNIQLPTKWIDLSNDQLKFVAKLFLSEFAKRPYKFLTHALVKFAKVKIKKVMLGEYILSIPGEKPFEVSGAVITTVASKLSWLLEEVTELHPLKRLWQAKPVNYRLHKTKFIRFLTAENFFMAFKIKNEVKYLNALVATLYDKPNQSFNDSLIMKRGRYFKWVRMYKKYTVYLWYSGFRWYVAKECPNLFESDGGGGEFKIKDHIMNMIRGLTEGDVTKQDNVLQVDTWDALYELDAKAKHMIEMKEKANKK